MAYYDDYLKQLNTTKIPKAKKVTDTAGISLVASAISGVKETQKGLLSGIRKNVQDGLTKQNGEDYSHLFDGIDDETIKKSREMAKSAIESNKRKNAYIDTPLERMPYMQDAMTMYYASIMSDNRTAAKLARSLAYSVHEPEEVSPSQSDPPKSDSRYVNDEKGVRFRSSPGLSGNIFGTLSAGTEVKYTGNKIYDIDGYNWAEVEYDGKKGYIADKYLAVSNQYENKESTSQPETKVEKQNIPPVREKTDEKENSYLGLPQMKNKTFYEFLQEQLEQKDKKPEENKEPSVEASAAEKPKEENVNNTRYVGSDVLKLYSDSTRRSDILLELKRGDRVEFTGKKYTDSTTNWAQVKVGDKTGWVFANYLKTDKEQTVPIESLPPYKQPRKDGLPLPVKHQTQQNVSKYACVIACDAIIFNYFGANVDVAELRAVNGDDKAKHYLLMDYAGLNGKIIYKDMWENKDSKSFIEAEKKDIEPQVFKKCREALQQGIPIMVEIQYYREGKRCTHSVVVYGVKGDGTKASDFLALDPWREETYNANYTNTLADSANMFRNNDPKINNWRIYYPIE